MRQAFKYIGLGLLVPLILMGFISTALKPPTKDKSLKEEDKLSDINALMQKVFALNKQKQHQKAIELLIDAIDRQKEDSLLRTLLIQSFELFLEEEISFGKDAIKDNAKDTKSYSRVAGALELLGDKSKAFELLTQGVSINNKSVDLWMKLARLELKAKRSNEALDIFKEVIRLDPKNSDAYNNAAYILVKAKEPGSNYLNEANTFAKKAMALDPDNPDYMDTMAEVQFMLGDHEKAKNLIKQAIRLSPNEESFKEQLKKFSNSSNNLYK